MASTPSAAHHEAMRAFQPRSKGSQAKRSALEGSKRKKRAYGRARTAGTRVVAAVKAGNARGVMFHQTLVAIPEQAQVVREMCQKRVQVADNLNGDEKKRKGPSEAYLEQDPSEQNVFFLWEKYPSNMAMAERQAEAGNVQWLEEVRPMLEEPVRMVLYEYQGDMLGVPSVYLGPKGEGGLDDATGAAGTNAGASYNQQMQVELGKVRRGDEGDSFGMEGKK